MLGCRIVQTVFERQSTDLFQNLKRQIYGSKRITALRDPVVDQSNRCFQIEKVIAENYNPSEEEWKAQCSANNQSNL